MGNLETIETPLLEYCELLPPHIRRHHWVLRTGASNFNQASLTLNILPGCSIIDDLTRMNHMTDIELYYNSTGAAAVYVYAYLFTKGGLGLYIGESVMPKVGIDSVVQPFEGDISYPVSMMFPTGPIYQVLFLNVSGYAAADDITVQVRGYYDEVIPPEAQGVASVAVDEMRVFPWRR